MFRRALIATDGTRLADDLVECAASLKALGMEDALLVHVFDFRHVGGLSADLEEKMLPQLERQAEVLRRSGVRAEVQTVVGLPARDLAAWADSWNASVVVLGSEGGGSPAGLPLGSTAAGVLHSARRPVLMFRVERLGERSEETTLCRAHCRNLFDHLLHPTDFSDGAEAAFSMVEAIVRQAKSRVTLLHVQDEVRLRPHLETRIAEFDRIDGERLARRVTSLREIGATAAEARIAHGRPVSKILEHAASGDVTLAVLGCQGRGFVREIFLGSVASAMARLAPVPALFVPLAR